MRNLLIFLLVIDCQAANHYIRAGASGANNGSSWANAYTAIPSTLTSGDTYYIAGGTYTGNVSLSASSVTTATLKKANAADNSGDAGWDISYASTQASIVGTLQIATGYLTIDGVTGAGSSGYGIRVYYATSSGGNALVNVAAGSAPNIWLSHIELEGSGFTDANGWSAFKQANGSSPTKGTRISYSYIHDFSQNGVVFTGVAGTSYADYGLLFENNIIYNVGATTGGAHGQGIQCGSGAAPETNSYWIIRNNVIHNNVGTANLACLGYSTNDHFQIYNNVFWNDNLSYNSGWMAYDNAYPPASPGFIYFSSTSGSADNILIANNTIYQMSRGTVYFGGTSTNNTVTNNLWINSNFNLVHQGVTGSYDDYYGCFTIIESGIYGVPWGEVGQKTESSNPVDASFKLNSGASAIGGGQNLSSVFTTDAAGVTRPASGAWDIGAYQYQSGLPAAGISGKITVGGRTTIK